MSDKLTRTELQYVRALNQHLVTASNVSISTLVARMGALQAQVKLASLLAIGSRRANITIGDVVGELHNSRHFIRTWCLRGTLHLVAADDVGWILDLVAPRILKNSERRYKQLALDRNTLSRATAYLSEALRERGALTRCEIASHLERSGIAVEGQQLPHILRRAALLSLICLGPDREDGTETYVLIEDWIGRELTRSPHGWSALAQRYLNSYGPASLIDFATWSGAFMGEARDAFNALPLMAIDVGGETVWMLEEQAPLLAQEFEAYVRLIPAYDPLLLGYQSRQWLVRTEFARQIHPGGGVLRPTVLVNGEAAGTWQMTRRKRFITVKMTPFDLFESDLLGLVKSEVKNLGRFFDIETKLKVV